MNATPAAIPTVLAEHFEQLQMLWQQRQHALSDPDYLREDVAELDQRLEAHVDGLLIAGAQATPILQEGLGTQEPEIAFAAAYVLLRRNEQGAADCVVEALRDAEQDQLAGIRQAFCYGPLGLVAPRLQSFHATGPPALAAAALEILTYHRQPPATPSRLGEFYSHADPQVRRAAWRITAMSAPAAPSGGGW